MHPNIVRLPRQLCSLQASMATWEEGTLPEEVINDMQRLSSYLLDL